MNIFDCFKFVVRLRASYSGFFVGCGCGFLHSLVNSDQGVFPLFDEKEPILYSFRSAGFVARELRRVGYNAHCVPYVFLMVKAALRAFKSRLQARMAAKSRWK